MPTPSIGDYIAALTAAAADARATAGESTISLHLAGLGAEIAIAGERVHAAVAPGIAHLQPADEAELTIHVWDGAKGAPLPPPPWDADAVVARGEIAGLGPDVLAAITTDTLSVYDRVSKQAYLWMPDVDTLPWWERAAPLRSVFSWWTRDHGKYFVHAAAVGRDGRSVLLAGPGGSGKSTTAVTCLLEGLDFLGGDYVIVEPGTPPVVHSVYSSAKLDDRSLELVPALQGFVAEPAARDADKSILYLAEGFADQLAPRSDLIGILLPFIGEDTALSPASPAFSLQTLAPSSIFQLPSAREQSFQAIAGLARTLPSSRLEIGPDPVTAVREIEKVLAAG